MADKEYILRCNCGDRTHHSIKIGQYDLDTDYSDAILGHCTIEATLNTYLPWYKRVLVAFNYIFGRTKHQYTDAVIDVAVLKMVVDSLQDSRSEEELKEAIKPKFDVTVL